MAGRVIADLKVPTKTGASTTTRDHCILDQYPRRELICTAEVSPILSFEILSYNILAQCYIFKSRYPHTKDFTQQFRHDNLIQEAIVIGLGDVVCYQEVTNEYFSTLLEPAMSQLGYSGLFQNKACKKPGGASSKDGLAIFHRQDRVIQLAVSSLVLNELLNEIWVELYGTDYPLPPECYQDTISLISVFNINGSVVVVGNIHLPWTKVYWDIQCLQVCLVLRKMAQLAQEHNSTAYILCGDFNRGPGSELYNLVTHGELDSMTREHFLHSDRRVSVPAQGASENETFPSYYQVFEKFYTIPEPMKSAYFTGMRKEPEYTFFADSQGCMDYIFYSSGLGVTSVLDVPTHEAVSSETSLPNSLMPSDHISIKAGFRNILTL